MAKNKQKSENKPKERDSLKDRIKGFRSKNIKKKTRKPVNGTDYEGKYTICPNCRMTGNKITNVLPEEDKTVIRYHACFRCGNSFKSVDVLD